MTDLEALVAATAPEKPATTENISVVEAARRLGVSKDWIYKNATTLPFVARIGTRVVCSAPAVEKFMAARLGRPHGSRPRTARPGSARGGPGASSCIDHLHSEGARSVRTTRVHLKPIREAFGTLRVAHLTTADIEQYKLTRRANGLAPATVNRELEALRSALRYSELPYPKITVFELDNARQGYFTASEIDGLLEEIPDEDVRDFVSWAFRTGMRRGEIRQLEWPMLDRSTATWVLRIPGTITKNAKGLSFGFAGEARRVMERRLRARRLDSQLIFHRAGRPMGPFRELWRSALKRAGLPGGRLVHDLRRSAIKPLIESGVDPLVAMKVSGHRTGRCWTAATFSMRSRRPQL